MDSIKRDAGCWMKFSDLKKLAVESGGSATFTYLEKMSEYKDFSYNSLWLDAAEGVDRKFPAPKLLRVRFTKKFDASLPFLKDSDQLTHLDRMVMPWATASSTSFSI